MSVRCLIACALLAACGSNDTGDDDGEPLGGSRTVAGEVVDFASGNPVVGAASVSTSGVVPAPRVTVQGAAFTIEGVPDNSAFQILSSVATTYRPTFSPAVVVVTDDLTGVKAPAMSEAYLASLATGFGVTPTAANGVLVAQLVNVDGTPRAGVPEAELVVAGGVMGPFFLDANLQPDPDATASSASGYVVFFEVPTGIVELGKAANAQLTLDMPASPVNAAGVTLARIEVTAGAPALPTNVSLVNDVMPIFSMRGCVACHSGGGIGKDLGGLKLDGPANQVYTELVTEDPTRVRTGAPETSLLLTMPSRESPADTHPNVTFASASDPDYLTILVWIQEGAKNN